MSNLNEFIIYTIYNHPQKQDGSQPLFLFNI